MSFRLSGTEQCSSRQVRRHYQPPQTKLVTKDQTTAPQGFIAPIASTHYPSLHLSVLHWKNYIQSRKLKHRRACVKRHRMNDMAASSVSGTEGIEVSGGLPLTNAEIFLVSSCGGIE
eukprot:4617223-Amphidinium_carterae.1